MKDQAEGLRRLVKQQKEAARVIAVTSGKGGVGKTNIAVNLALALRERDFRVVLIDVDLGLANVDILLGITPALTWGMSCGARRTMQEIMAEGPWVLKFSQALQASPIWPISTAGVWKCSLSPSNCSIRNLTL